MPVPHWDSTIRVAPGVTFSLDIAGNNEWLRKTAALREARGTTLALAFEVEHSVDVVISRFFFPNTDSQSQELKTLFEESFLKSASANFARKLQVFKTICQQPPLCSLVSSDLHKNLIRLKDLRNLFAHYPIVFDPSDGQGSDKLTAKLVSRDKDITLDEEFFSNAEKLFGSVKGELQKILSVFGVPAEGSRTGGSTGA